MGNGKDADEEDEEDEEDEDEEEEKEEVEGISNSTATVLVASCKPVRSLSAYNSTDHASDKSIRSVASAVYASFVVSPVLGDRAIVAVDSIPRSGASPSNREGRMKRFAFLFVPGDTPLLSKRMSSLRWVNKVWTVTSLSLFLSLLSPPPLPPPSLILEDFLLPEVLVEKVLDEDRVDRVDASLSALSNISRSACRSWKKEASDSFSKVCSSEAKWEVRENSSPSTILYV